MRIWNSVACLLGLGLFGFWVPSCFCKAQATDVELEELADEIGLTSPGLLSRDISQDPIRPELDSQRERRLYSLKSGKPSSPSATSKETHRKRRKVRRTVTSSSASLLGPADGKAPDSSMSALLLGPTNAKASGTSMSVILLGPANRKPSESSMSATLLGPANARTPSTSTSVRLLGPAKAGAPSTSTSALLLGPANGKAPDLSMSAKLLGPANRRAPEPSMSAVLLGPANGRAPDLSISATSLGPANGRAKASGTSTSTLLLGPAHASAKAPDAEAHHKVLDHEGDVQLTWYLNLVKDIITFEISARTLGYIGFGLNAGGGGMDEADIVIGGVYSNGNSYFMDYHGTGNQMPVVDQHQSWRLEGATKNGSHTTLKFSRALDTCDLEDVPINNDTLNIIWAFGDLNGNNDAIAYHMANRGTVAINLLDPPYPNLDTERVPSFEISVEMVMPPKEFTYWCTAHRAPEQFKGKAHIIGFKPKLYGPIAVRHTHHFVLYKCNDDTPSGALEDKAKSIGEDCYGVQAPQPGNGTQVAIPMNVMCPTTLYVWGAGGELLLLPEHVGYPVGLAPGEYFMLEVHFDNPTRKENVQFRAGVEILYSKKLRQHDAAMMTIGHATMASLLIPPMTANWKIQGHCSGECTKKFVPAKGIQIINAMLHSHLAGRKMKFRHFRGNEELPWVSYDDHYHFNYQKNRPIRNERTILPGDQLTFECVYDSYGRPNVTIGGFSTANEMCETFIWYYPAIPNALSCTSFIPPDLVFGKFGIRKTKLPKGFEVVNDPTVLEPLALAGKSFTEVLNTQISWTEAIVKDFQGVLHTTPQIASCPAPATKPAIVIGQMLPPSRPPMPPKPILVNIPFLNKLYQPPSSCTQISDSDRHELLFYGGDGQKEQNNQTHAPISTSTQRTTSIEGPTSTSTEKTTSTETPTSTSTQRTTSTETPTSTSTERTTSTEAPISTSTEAATTSTTTTTTTATEYSTTENPDSDTDIELITRGSNTAPTTATTTKAYSTTETSGSDTEIELITRGTNEASKTTMTTTTETTEPESTTPNTTTTTTTHVGPSKHRNRTRHNSRKSKKSSAAGSVTLTLHAHACSLTLVLFTWAMFNVGHAHI